jgi:hypothetical protein
VALGAAWTAGHLLRERVPHAIDPGLERLQERAVVARGRRAGGVAEALDALRQRGQRLAELVELLLERRVAALAQLGQRLA